jgi:hypothetical protein
MKFKVIPVPDGEFWACASCAFELDRLVVADVLLVVDREIEQVAPGLAGMCGNHAEVFVIDLGEDTVGA